jgi:2-beta-glucuronyltransferase
MVNVILISAHYFLSRRKAGFHWLAESFANKLSWNVLFVTAPISLISWFCRDHRFEHPIFEQSKKVICITDHIRSYVYLTPFAPLPSKNTIFNIVSALIAKFYGKHLPPSLKQELIRADLIIFESTSALLLFEEVCGINPDAKKIYRVSDDLEVIHAAQQVIDCERKIAPKFDLISVPSEYIYRKFAHLPNCRLHYHGINKELFSKQYDVPEEYTKFEKNIVFVGTSHFDYDFIKIAAESFPHWGFHIIGPLKKVGESPNLLYYGEMPFAKTVPYIQHADVGLQNRISDRGLASLSDSLKILQYTYCKLPIVAPIGLQSSRKNFVYYVPGEKDSIRTALAHAVEYDRKTIDISNIYSWGELAEILIKEVSNV